MLNLNKKYVYFLLYIIIFFELLFLKYFINLKKKTSLISYKLNKNNYKIIKIIKRNIEDKFFKTQKKNITYVNTLYIYGHLRFGNYFISLNNAIIFCEIFGCKKIIIKNNFINHKIFYLKYNLTIESSHSFNNTDNNSIFLKVTFFMFHCNLTDLGNVNRFFVFRKEILNNLPKVKINCDDLYIYLRGGDIFRNFNKTNRYYVQPPLCFYKTILNQFVFRKVIIISEDTSNPVISILFKEYPYIKYNTNNVKLDISYLVNSYNIISATSSFIECIIKLNQNIKYLWEYDFYMPSERYFHLHHSVYTFSFNYTIYKMNVSEKYKKLMFPFINSENQRIAMIEEKCENNFFLIPPRFS